MYVCMYVYIYIRTWGRPRACDRVAAVSPNKKNNSGEPSVSVSLYIYVCMYVYIYISELGDGDRLAPAWQRLHLYERTIMYKYIYIYI